MIWRHTVAAAAISVLAGCSGLHPNQSHDSVLIRHGDFDRELPAVDYAKHFLPYAIFALKSYDTKRVKGVAGVRDTIPSKNWNELSPRQQQDAEALIAKWEKIDSFDSSIDSKLPCGRPAAYCTNLPGLGYDVWVKEHCSEVVVAFRGTNFSQWEDWISNFRWVTRILPLFDQYEQVQDNIDRILSKVTKHCPHKNPPVVATGHSLGGGLAQQAAYMSKKIRRVVVFAPSMVTGYMDRHVPREETRFNLQIERVYEHGEILAYPRLVVRTVLPNSVRDPLIRTSRFNHVHNQSIVGQHSMAKLTATIMEFAKRSGRRSPKPMPCDVAAFRAASYAPYTAKDCVSYSEPGKAGDQAGY